MALLVFQIPLKIDLNQYSRSSHTKTVPPPQKWFTQTDFCKKMVPRTSQNWSPGLILAAKIGPPCQKQTPHRCTLGCMVEPNLASTIYFPAKNGPSCKNDYTYLILTSRQCNFSIPSQVLTLCMPL